MKRLVISSFTRISSIPVFLILPLLAFAFLTGCSSGPSTSDNAKPVVKDPEYVTGRTAFQKMYASARGWQRDAQGYQLESQFTQDFHGKDGKSGLWRGSFGSATQRTSKTYTWSGSNASDAPERGITPSPEDSFSPTNTSTHAFDMAFLKIDSDQALAVALKHGGDKLMVKDANQPVLYRLNWATAENMLVWHVMFGASSSEVKLNVIVNASTGDFVRAE